MKWVRRYVPFVLSAGATYLLLVGSFTVAQTIWLALIVACVIQALFEVKRPAPRFIPYYIRIEPSWSQILTDFKLVDGANGWKAIQDTFTRTPQPDFCLLRDPIYITIIQQLADFEHAVMYFRNRQDFSSVRHIEEVLEPIKLNHEERGDQNVRFFVKSGTEGYNLGISVPHWWWEKMRISCPKPEAVVDDNLTGRVELILAVVPRSEFETYSVPRRSLFGPNNKTLERAQVRRDEQRKKFGWTTSQETFGRNMFGMEDDLLYHITKSSEIIYHKYFAVSHRQI